MPSLTVFKRTLFQNSDNIQNSIYGKRKSEWAMEFDGRHCRSYSFDHKGSQPGDHRAQN